MQPYIFVVLDFNALYTTDPNKLQKIMDFLHHCLSRCPTKSAALIWLPDHRKDGTSLHDEVTAITSAMKAYKLDYSLDIICNTRTLTVLCTHSALN